VGIGGPWALEIGDLEGLGGFGITNEDIHMSEGGAHVVVSLAHSSGVRGPVEGFGVLSAFI
jgi:hypothetical protein